MRITTRQPKRQPAPKKDASQLNTPENNRHQWDPDKAKWVRRLRDVAIPLLLRTKDEGFENIPDDGNAIVAPTHQSMYDALVASRVPAEPYGSMTDVNQFKGLLGKALSNFGSFPVDRWGEYEGDFADPVDHAIEILDDNKNFIFYPEGRIYADPVVYPLKTGIGRIGVASKAKYALPVAQHYSKDTESHPVETTVGVALSAGVAAAGMWAATQGGVIGAVAGLATGLVAGAVVGAGAGYLAGPKGDLKKRGFKAAKWAGFAAAGTAVAGAVVGGMVPGAAPLLGGTTSALTGVVGLGLTYHMTHRPIAHTKVAKPIELEPYRQRAAASAEPDAEWKEARRLTADFYEVLKETKTSLTGVESPFKMDYDGNRWGLQEDGSWAQVERNADKEWVPVTKD